VSSLTTIARPQWYKNGAIGRNLGPPSPIFALRHHHRLDYGGKERFQHGDEGGGIVHPPVSSEPGNHYIQAGDHDDESLAQAPETTVVGSFALMPGGRHHTAKAAAGFELGSDARDWPEIGGRQEIVSLAGSVPLRARPHILVDRTPTAHTLRLLPARR
jgi:hypothetical protein